MDSNWHLRLLPLLFALIAGLFILVKGCQEGPFGRRQIVAMNPEQEARLGVQAFQQVLAESEVINQGKVFEAVKRVSGRIADAAEKKEVKDELKVAYPKYQWDFRLVKSNQVNAFCLPGGKIVVYTGIVPVAKNETGLATVLGHEIGHALAHHGSERMARQELVNLGTQAVAGSLSDLSPRQRMEVMAVLGAGSQYGISLPFDRRQESEADHIGLILMAAAGYDPRESIAFWQRMEEVGGAHPPEFSSTHPSHQHRIRDLKELMRTALPFYERSQQSKAGITGS